jgi:hypothetical protein
MTRREEGAGASGTRPGGPAEAIPPGSRAPGLEATWTRSIIPVSAVNGSISGKSARVSRTGVPEAPAYLGIHAPGGKGPIAYLGIHST